MIEIFGAVGRNKSRVIRNLGI